MWMLPRCRVQVVPSGVYGMVVPSAMNGDGRAGGRIFQWGTILDLRGNDERAVQAETENTLRR